MTGLSRIAVRGSGYAAPLAALVLARFAVAAPGQVTLSMASDAGLDDDALIIRPKMAALHRAIGLDLAAAGAKRIQSWRGPNGAALPFAAPPSEGGVGFQHLATREGRLDAASRSPREGRGGYVVSARAYEDVLSGRARRVGVEAARGTVKAPLSVIASGRPGTAWEGGIARIGEAVLPTRLPSALGPHVAHRTLMNLVACLPSDASDPLLEAEYARRTDAMRPCLGAMEALLLGEEDEAVAHRKRLWAASGHLVSEDDDPFSAGEWVAALTTSAGAPRDYQRLADAVAAKQGAARG